MRAILKKHLLAALLFAAPPGLIKAQLYSFGNNPRVKPAVSYKFYAYAYLTL